MNIQKNEHGNIDARHGIPAGTYLCRKKWKKRAEKLGHEFLGEALIGFKKSRHGYAPRLRCLFVGSEGELDASIAADEEKRKKAAEKAKKRASEARYDLAEEIGCEEDSRTMRWSLSGEIDLDEAKRIAKKCRHRHEDTRYDSLLRQGMDKETARACAEEE